MTEKLVIPSRDKRIADYERDYGLRMPDARVGEGTLPGIDARILADALGPLDAEASRMADDAVLENKTIDQLKIRAKELGLPELLPAVGASGELDIVTSLGGATILAGTIATYEPTGIKYQCTATAVYSTGDRVPVQAVDTGPNTDLHVGATLKWNSPPSGLSQNATVAASAQGGGLTGGRLEESQSDLVRRIADAQANPPAAGNSADYRKLALATPGVAVEEAFMYPCILGNGTLAMCFTLRPDSSGGSRIPDNTQIAAVKANCIGSLPADDSLYACTVVGENVSLCLRVRWAVGSVGWTDGVPWPQYQTNQVLVSASPAPTPTSFRLSSASAPGNPQAGQTIAFYDKTNERFVAKRIKTVTGTGPWDITCETALTASDTSYTPLTGDIACPWSDLLNQLVAPTIAEFDKLGPGEQVATPYDTGGQRQKRDPAGSQSWPSELNGRITIPLYALSSVDEVQVAKPTLPSATAVGTPGVSSYLKQLDKFAVFPV